MKSRSTRTLAYVAGSFGLYCAMAAWSAAGGTLIASWGILARIVGAAPSFGAGSPIAAGAEPVASALAGEAEGGSRLRANYYVGDDGSKQFAYFTDSLLGDQECEFATAGDGTVRCLPSAGAVVSGFFSDPSCSVPIALTDATPCTPPRYAAWSEVRDCGRVQVHIYPVTGLFGGYIYGSLNYDPRSWGQPGAPFPSTGGTACVVVPGVSLPERYTPFTIGDEVPPNTFQGAVIRSD